MARPRIIMLECVNHSEAGLAAEYLGRQSGMLGNLISDVVVLEKRSWSEFNKWFVSGLRDDKIDSSGYDFILHIEPDASVASPGAWTDAFLEYDYVGAPWLTFDVVNKVGNSGFSLMSRKFVECVRKLPRHLVSKYRTDMGCDMYLCDCRHGDLVAMGVKFAPLDAAERFSIEYGEYSGQFGVHYKVKVGGTELSLKEHRFTTFQELVRESK